MKKNRHKKAGTQPPTRPAGSSAPATPVAWRHYLQPGDRYTLAAVLLTALALRLIFFFLNRENNPLFSYPIMDALYHDEWAKKIIGGEFWGNEVFFRAPLYPYFLALIYKFSGSSLAVAVLLQHLIGSVSAMLTALLARLWFGRGTALVAGLLAALYWPLIYFEGQLLIVTLAIFLDLLLLVALTAAVRRPCLRTLLLAGLTLGCSAITRPSILIMLPVLPVLFYFAAAHASNRSRWKLAAGWTALVCAGAMVLIAPVTIRNYAVGYDFVPIASQGGVNFYIGNNPQSDGRTAIVPGTRPDWWGGYFDAIKLAEEHEGRQLQPSEVSNHYFKRGLSFMAGSPLQAARLLLHKFRLFWAGGERANNMNIYFFWRITGMNAAPLPGFWLIGPVGLLGMCLLWRRRSALSLLYLFVAAYAAGVILFFVNARFRLPVLPVLIIFAATAPFSLVHLWRASISRFALALGLLLLLAVGVNIDFATFKEHTVYADAFSHYSLGNAYLKMERKDLALREYERAYEKSRRYPVPSYRLIERNVHHNLGTLYWEQERCAEAIRHLSQVGGNDSFAVLASRYLGECYVKEGLLAEAVRSFNDALAIDPADLPSLIGLGETCLRLGERERARQFYLRARQLSPRHPRVESLGRSLGGG